MTSAFAIPESPEITDLIEAQAIFERSPVEELIDRDAAIRKLCQARQISRDGTDTSGSQAAIINMLEYRT